MIENRSNAGIAHPVPISILRKIMKVPLMA